MARTGTLIHRSVLWQSRRLSDWPTKVSGVDSVLQYMMGVQYALHYILDVGEQASNELDKILHEAATKMYEEVPQPLDDFLEYPPLLPILDPLTTLGSLPTQPGSARNLIKVMKDLLTTWNICPFLDPESVGSLASASVRVSSLVQPFALQVKIWYFEWVLTDLKIIYDDVTRRVTDRQIQTKQWMGKMQPSFRNTTDTFEYFMKISHPDGQGLSFSEPTGIAVVLGAVRKRPRPDT